MTLPQGTLESLPLEHPEAAGQPDELELPVSGRPPAFVPRLNLLGLRLGQLQLGAELQANRQPLYGQLSLEAQWLRTELVPPVEAGSDRQSAGDGQQNQNHSDDQNDRGQDRAPLPFGAAPPAATPAVPFHFKLEGLLSAPRRVVPQATPAVPAEPALSASASADAEPDFSTYLSHTARVVLKQVEHFTARLTELAPQHDVKQARTAAAAGAVAPAAQQAPLTATQVINAINNNVPVHIADFPAFVNRVLQTLDPGSRVMQSFEVSLRPADLGQVTAQFSLTTKSQVMITMYTQSAVTAQTLEACKQEIQQIVEKTQLTLGQLVVKQAIAPARQGGQTSQGGSFGSGQQGTGAADYSSRQFRRNQNRRRRGGDDNLSIDVSI